MARTKKKLTYQLLRTLVTSYTADCPSEILVIIGYECAWDDVTGRDSQVVGAIITDSRRGPKVAVTAPIAEGSAANAARAKQVIGEVAESFVYNGSSWSSRTGHV